ncbi:MAG TPA: hypothetical protein VLT35_05220 [Methanocella sp.]|nr:hypothetical protein [Methanocella sp.]
MRIPDDIRELLLALLEPEAKRGLMRMTYEEIDELLLREITIAVGPGYLEPDPAPGAFPYRFTEKGREVKQILAPCKRSGK